MKAVLIFAKISDEELSQVIKYHRRLVVGVTVPEGKSEGR